MNKTTLTALLSITILTSVVAISDISPAFADHSEVTIEAAMGSSSLGCAETAEGCYLPTTATVAVGGKVIFSNPDSAAHTFSAGSLADGLSGEFDTGLLMAGNSFEYSPDTVGEIPYFCMVHPWMEGVLIVVDESQHVVNPGELPLTPENGHYYEYIESAGISWTDAKAAAENSTHNGRDGHLVTITSQSENDFVTELVPDGSRSWIGLSDETIEGQYKWVTGELFAYFTWNNNYEDNIYLFQDYVAFLKSNNYIRWDETANYNDRITGYIVEYNVPLLNPDNGHYYEYVIDNTITWTDAKTAAENSTYNGLNGHLATITSASENDFIAKLGQYGFHPWIGLSDETTEGTYTWVTGEPFNYTNWNYGQPSGSGYSEDYIVYFGWYNTWYDAQNNSDLSTGYVIEYSD